MEKLPFLFLKELFRMMPSLNEAIKCSHVCRSWRAAYEAMFKPETLYLYHQDYIQLNERLFYTNERLHKFNFLRLRQSSIRLRFFDSDAASVHFASLKKLIISYPLDWPNYSSESRCKLSLKDQFNAFKSLEYLQINCDILGLECCELDLPILKILSWGGRLEGEKHILLNTPNLEAMRIFTGLADPENCLRIVNVHFKFPQALKHLDLVNYETNFKFDFSSFVNLECLVFSRVCSEIYEKNLRDLLTTRRENEVRLFGDDFLETLPKLKFLFFEKAYCTRSSLPRLVEEKRKFKLNDLKILNCLDFIYPFDYQNWPRYLEHKEHLKYWPSEVDLVFDKLITFRVPLGLFKENYLKISTLKVRQTDNQTLLVDFLRNIEFTHLVLKNDCNLGQCFFNEIADSSVSIPSLTLYGWHQFSDLTVLSRLNMATFVVYYQKFHREAALAVLSNSACLTFRFDLCQVNCPQVHIIRRVKDEFYCQPCAWISIKDRAPSEHPMEVTLKHIEKDYPQNNTTLEERQAGNLFADETG